MENLRKYRAIVKAYNDDVKTTRWYNTWSEAQMAGERLSKKILNLKSIDVESK